MPKYAVLFFLTLWGAMVRAELPSSARPFIRWALSTLATIQEGAPTDADLNAAELLYLRLEHAFLTLRAGTDFSLESEGIASGGMLYLHRNELEWMARAVRRGGTAPTQLLAQLRKGAVPIVIRSSYDNRADPAIDRAFHFPWPLPVKKEVAATLRKVVTLLHQRVYPEMASRYDQPLLSAEFDLMISDLSRFEKHCDRATKDALVKGDKRKHLAIAAWDHALSAAAAVRNLCVQLLFPKLSE